MSFLNPVNEPVLRFSSTDADAPQIDYNARVAGDVKAVLKACLVDGYSATASAGWTAVNEVDNVIEFVSPSAAMSDYRLGIDDSTATKTDWYYQYQDARVNPGYNSPSKAMKYIDAAHGDNGWQLFVTARGLLFVELVQSSVVKKLSARITYWGAVKSGVPTANGKNICFFNIGHNAATSSPNYFYSSRSYVHTALDTQTGAYMSAATSNALAGSYYQQDVSSIDLVSPIYIASTEQALLIAELPPILSKIVNNTADLFGVSDSVLDGREVFSVSAARGAYSNITDMSQYSRTFLIKTDYWEY